jgi:small GTP-binding protein
MDLGETNIIVIGPVNVGKTSIVNFGCFGYAEPTYQPTPGAQGHSVRIQREEGFSVRLHFWDTAGEERFRCMFPSYLRNRQVAIFVFSLAEPSTLSALSDFFSLLEKHVQPSEFPKLYVVGNKLDLAPDGPSPNPAGQEYADSINAAYFDTSAVTGYNIDVLLADIAAAVPIRRQPVIESGAGEGDLQTAEGESKCC